MNSYDLVREFHLKNGHAAPDTHTVLTPGLALLRVRLVHEELGELAVALHEENLIETADGLTDLYYVVVGTAVTAGLQEPVVEPREPKGKLTHFLEPSVRLFVLANLSRCAKNLTWELAKPKGDVRDLCWALRTFTAELTVAADLFGLPLQELLDEVHSSNMSKNLSGRSGDSKYGGVDPKGQGYHPPNIQGIISRCQVVTEGNGQAVTEG